ARQHGDSTIADAIIRSFMQAQEAANRGYNDDAPVHLLGHRPSNNLTGEAAAGEIDVHDPMPVRILELQRGSPLRGAGGVQQDVDPAQFLLYSIHDALDVFTATHVCRHFEGAPAQRADLRSGLSYFFLAPADRH